MNQQHQTAVTAGFVMEGLFRADFMRAVQEYDQGALELVDAVMTWVPVIDTLRETADGMGLDYPGVFEYEVTSSFGAWLGGSIIDDGELPGQVHAMEILIDSIESFFRVKDDKNVARRLRARLDAKAGEILAPQAANDGA